MATLSLAMKPKSLASFVARWRGWLQTLDNATLDGWWEKQRASRNEQVREAELQRQAWLALHDRLRHRLHARRGKTKR